MSDTPRTDSYVYKFPGCQREPRLIDFARQLEREIAEARAEIERLKEYTTCTLESTDAEMDDKDIQIIKKDKLIEQMKEALSVLIANATPSGPLWHGSAEMQIAKAALEAAEMGEG